MRDRFRAGDPAALGEAYDEHARVLYHYAYRVCGDRAAAEDVVSSAFLEAWRCRGKVHADGGSLRPWLLGIATNIMRGAAREARRRDAALARIPERGVMPDFADDVLARVTDGEQIRAARVALGRLRRREREVFTLVVWAGLDYASAGEALGVPVGTVRSRLSRARERLRKLAEEELRAGRRRERSAPAARSAGRPGGGVGSVERVAHPAPGTTDTTGYPAPEVVEPVGRPAPGAAGPARHPEPDVLEQVRRPAPGALDTVRDTGPGALGQVPHSAPGGTDQGGHPAPDRPARTGGPLRRALAAPGGGRSTVRPGLAPRPHQETQA
ncbi:sigma-70 family RNA polymerase sigma factor [Streptomyces sp. NPDC090303]|uniref:RNA polymerase sigma factor n=1 Tax=Streptomyces sp. NPDC090303 TaxID=3365960 RepID=UPI0037F50A4E